MKTLKQYRENAELSIKDVATHMGVSTRIVYSWEDGSRTIGSFNLAMLLSLYQVDLPISAIPKLLIHVAVGEENTVTQ